LLEETTLAALLRELTETQSNRDSGRAPAVETQHSSEIARERQDLR
jgi:hypothetical protein